MKTLTFFLALAAFAFAATTAQGNPPRITDFLNVPEGTNAYDLSSTGYPMLECKPLGLASNEEAPEISWFKDDEVIDGETSTKLILKSDHRGYIHCLASNELGVAKSRVVRVYDSSVGDAPAEVPEWAIAPKFTVHPKMKVEEIGRNVEFHCEAQGSPIPGIQWLKNGEVIREVEQSKDVLSIERFGPEDIGAYACNASNSVGYVYYPVYLTILAQAPYFLENPRNRTVSIGQDVIMRCSAKGYPEPKIRWFLNDTVIDLNANERYTQSERGDLSINLIRESDGGSYKCEASNEQGIAEETGFLNVVSTTTIETGPVDMEAQVQSTTVMNCSVLWDPAFKLTVNWKKDNMDLRPSAGSRISTDEKTNALVIKDLEFSDSGTYTCVASTSQGSTTESGTLKVVGIPPTLESKAKDHTVRVGGTIRVPCKVTGIPTPRNTWMTDDVDTGDINVIVFDGPKKHPRASMDADGSLVIYDAKPEDTLKYICKAENNYKPNAIDSAFVDVRYPAEIIKEPVDVIFDPSAASTSEDGESRNKNITLPCGVKVDDHFLTEAGLNITWTKGDIAIKAKEIVERPTLEYDDSAEEVETDEESLFDTTAPSTKYVLHADHSLTIFNVTESDLDTYACHVITPIDKIVLQAVIYKPMDNSFWWLIILLVVLCLLILLFLCCCLCWIRKRTYGKSDEYCVKDMEDGKKKTLKRNGNKSDIAYTIAEDEDGDDPTEYSPNDQILDDLDGSKGGSEASDKKPILKSTNSAIITSTPAGKGKQNGTKGENKNLLIDEEMRASENSLLNLTEEELWLRKGMDEDGSFREGKYADQD